MVVRIVKYSWFVSSRTENQPSFQLHFESADEKKKGECRIQRIEWNRRKRKQEKIKGKDFQVQWLNEKLFGKMEPYFPFYISRGRLYLFKQNKEQLTDECLANSVQRTWLRWWMLQYSLKMKQEWKSGRKLK